MLSLVWMILFVNFTFWMVLHVHFDNAVGQNKNQTVIWYAMWRVLTGLLIGKYFFKYWYLLLVTHWSWYIGFHILWPITNVMMNYIIFYINHICNWLQYRKLHVNTEIALCILVYTNSFLLNCEGSFIQLKESLSSFLPGSNLPVLSVHVRGHENVPRLRIEPRTAFYFFLFLNTNFIWL